MTGSDPTGYTTDLSHSLTIPLNTRKPSTVMTDDCYDRIQGRIKREFHRQNPAAWLAGMFSFLTVGVSALLAWIVLPRNISSLPPGTRPTLLTILVAALILTVVCGIGHHGARGSIDAVARDICDEMDKYSVKSVSVPEAGGDSNAIAIVVFYYHLHVVMAGGNAGGVPVYQCAVVDRCGMDGVGDGPGGVAL